MNQGRLTLHIFFCSIIFVIVTTLKTTFLNVIGSECFLMFIIGALNSLYCGGVFIDVLKTILTALMKGKDS